MGLPMYISVRRWMWVMGSIFSYLRGFLVVFVVVMDASGASEEEDDIYLSGYLDIGISGW
jgi:hypothetical protein